MDKEQLVVISDVYEVGKNICVDLVNLISGLKTGKLVREGEIESLKIRIEFEIKQYMILTKNKLHCEAAECLKNYIRTYVDPSASDFERKFMIKTVEPLQKEFERIVFGNNFYNH